MGGWRAGTCGTARPRRVLLLLVIAAATATLTLGLALHGVTSQPYAQTRAATHGPDLVALLTGVTAPHRPGQDNPGPPVLAQVQALVHAAGVSGHSGPYPLAGAVLRARGRTAGVEVEGRRQAPASARPAEVTAGSWVRGGGVVLERTFAEALGVGAGDRITLRRSALPGRRDRGHRRPAAVPEPVLFARWRLLGAVPGPASVSGPALGRRRSRPGLDHPAGCPRAGLDVTRDRRPTC